MPRSFSSLRSIARVCAAFFVASITAVVAPAANGVPPINPVSLTPIRLNTIGYQPEAPKRASIAAECDAFRVIRIEDGTVALTGHVGAPVTTARSDTGETVRIADFSVLMVPGHYALEVPGVGRSAPFTVGREVWNEPCAAVVRAFYYWRCGTAVSGTWQGHTFSHAACHLEDGWLDDVGGGHVRRPGTGGWHDAGDYNKYVVNAGVSVALMLQAFEQNRAAFEHLAVGLPESGRGLPDLLAEIRWELDWLFTMQLPDGRVYHKLSQHNFRFWGPAEADKDDRYFAPWSTTATADFAATMAAAARTFRAYDADYAARCLAAAKVSWACLAAHPQNMAPDLHEFHTGAYAPDDATHRLWAAVELWETTGEETYLREFERRAGEYRNYEENGPSWGDSRDLAFGTYLLSRRPAARDAALVARLSHELVATADKIVATAAGSAYARPMGGERGSWFWGCNGMIAAQTYLLEVANRVRPNPRYRATVLDAVAFLFGRNYHGRSYVTGLGANPPEHPHDRRGEPAWPGYLVGGAWPTGRDWVDDYKHYELNEIALNWNAALVFALSGLVSTPTPATNVGH